MNYLKLYVIIFLAITTASAVKTAIHHYRTREVRMLERTRLKLKIKLMKKRQEQEELEEQKKNSAMN